MTIKIVTDSACDLPEEVVQSLGITVVPLYINIGDKGFLDGVEITRKEFYANLPTFASHPTTAAPGMDSFTQVYQQLADEGAEQILSIHISRSLSGTIDVAESAAREFQEIPVLVRDSGQLSTGVGFQVETAARMAQDGETLEEIIKALDDLADRSIVAARLDTLEYLRRSGRMNRFMAGLGSLLQIKPILTMNNGLPKSERVRTARKAEARLVRILEACQPLERFALLHVNVPAEAEAFRSRIAHLIPAGEILSLEITPVIGSHIGAGAVGFAAVSKNAIGTSR
jgi:DegV family protein with EDD domain